jgi:sugar transferase (PEP-CTERM/EpsH1 system associated)
MVRVADYVDVESAKLEQRVAGRSWPAGRFGRRAAARQLALECAAAAGIDHLLFASNHAAELFRERAPEHAHRVRTVGNGVDAEYFSPHILHRNPYPSGCRALVFAGAMDDWTNAEAADWFARRVFAPLRAADPALHFYVVGARPCARVQALARRSGVVVTGSVPDLRPYLAHAALAVAPLQHAHGIQNKVLEAMAMQQVVLATPAALAGIPAAIGTEVLQACDAAQFAQAIRTVPGSPTVPAIGRAARARVLRECGWHTSLARLSDLLAPTAPRHARGG